MLDARESEFSPWRWPIAAPRRVIRRQAERHDAIVAAAGEAASEGGMAAIQIAPVAARAGIAAGTVYRYFPSKTDLVGALVASAAEREIDAVRRAAARRARAAVGARRRGRDLRRARRCSDRRLAWAMIAEPADADTDAMRLRLSPGAGRASSRRCSGRRSPAAICRDRCGVGGAGADRRADRRPGRAAVRRTSPAIPPRPARRCRR